jgi:hypothetical protein
LDPKNEEKPDGALRDPAAKAHQHDGTELSDGADFFVAPPPEIGAIKSQSSTLRRDKTPLSGNLRLLVVSGGLLLGAALGVAVVKLFSVYSSFWSTFWPVSLALLGGALAWGMTGFRHTCSYVGEKGAAKFTCKGRRERVVGREVLLFEQAAELRTAVTRNYTNGVYSGTTYDFTWKDGRGERCYTIAGGFNKKDGKPPTKDLFHFAEAAEAAWTVHLLDRAQHQLDSDGFIQFDLGRKNKDYVRIGRGFMEFFIKGKNARCEVEDIETLQIGKGWFTIKRKDAKVGWFRKDGVFQFPYASMANARLFLVALEAILGFRFGPQ